MQFQLCGILQTLSWEEGIEGNLPGTEQLIQAEEQSVSNFQRQVGQSNCAFPRDVSLPA